MGESFDRSAADYQRARFLALIHRIQSVVSGRPRRLLAFDEVRERLRLGGPLYRGVQSVPLAQIIGSVDRYRDFDRLFLPTQSHTEDRWRKISRAWYDEVDLPPVLLYKVGEVYFVVDGNHRVSVAREHGQTHIDAEVREVESRVPVTPDIRAEDLQRMGETVEFLERTRLDRLRPEAVVEPTILGGYDRLLEHICVHRYFMGIDEKRPVSEEESVTHWYDTLYRPVVDLVESSDVLDEFPGRTATDLYLWIMDHLHFLRGQPGGEQAGPADAAEDFIESA
ncbi:MAG TPA: hypothetical protein VLD63_05890 [Anaerolineales bacterium]|nr:hypothetical protein [Anaerolineales bacterium]